MKDKGEIAFMKKRVAILTLPLGLNYGNVIQNFALQQVIKDLGFYPVTINRRHNEKSKYIQFRIRLYQILKQTEYINLSEYFKKNRLFRHNFDFIKNHITHTKAISSDNKMQDFMQKNIFDFYLVGSDQTWRPQFAPNIYNYYLDFLVNTEIKNCCIAYASSFGTDIWEYTEEQTQRVKELVKKFDAISVREDSGVELCRKYLNMSAKHVLDPTMLLNAEQYTYLLKLSENRTAMNQLYTYILDKNQENQLYIEKCANHLGLTDTSSQPMKNHFRYKRGDQFKDYMAPPIEDWLSGFKNASFIITDSFHGTVFSIIFQKPFVTIINSKRGASRFHSLLSNLGLGDRMVESLSDFNYKLLEEDIDYLEVNKALEVLKQDSLKFLSNALSSCY